MAYIGKSPDGTGVRARYYFTATGGETSLSGADDNAVTLSFADGAYVDVYLNGVLLVAGTDYNTTTTNTISGLSSLAANDIVEILVYDIFTVADTVSASAGGTFSGAVGFSGGITGDVAFDTNTLKVDSSNNRVGIGTASPATTAHIQTSSGNPELRIESTGANYATVSVKNSSRHYSTQIRTDQSNAYVVRDETAGANRFAIDTSGNVGIGTSTPASLLEIKAAALNRANGIALRGSGANDVLYMYPSADNVATIEHLIDGSTSTGGNIVINPQGGDVQLGTTTNHGDNNQGGVTFQAATFDRMIMNIGHTDGSSRPVVRFFGNASESSSGNISCDGSSTAYNTSSDARLKENVADMTGAIDRVKALAPKRFNFIADDTVTVDGFLAHEAQAVVPEAVTGEHNEVDEDGNAVMQGIDQSKLVPLLTGALREAIAKIEALETSNADLTARIEALETGS